MPHESTIGSLLSKIEPAELNNLVGTVIGTESTQFAKTLSKAEKVINKLVKSAPGTIIDGALVFGLQSTLGIPLEISRDMLMKRGFTIDQDTYEQAVRAHQIKSRDKK